MAKYALLFAGGVNSSLNYPRYANDIGFMHAVLCDKYAYSSDNIKVLYADGTGIDYNNVKILAERATKRQFLDALAVYSTKLTDEDSLIIMISNHGGPQGISTWGPLVISMNELQDMLNRIKCVKVILLGQCYGGDLLNYEVRNSVVISGNEKGAVTYAALNDRNYDEFLYQFTSCLNGEYPCGAQLNGTSGVKTVEDAYEYVKNNNAYRNGINISGNLLKETPQIKYSDIQGSIMI